MSNRPASSPVQASIVEALDHTFIPDHLEVINESGMHNVPPNSETHFKVVVVSDQFEGLAPIQRHRKVHAALVPQLAGPVHALSIAAYTPRQWHEVGEAPESPECLGGSAAEKKN